MEDGNLNLTYLAGGLEGSLEGEAAVVVVLWVTGVVVVEERLSFKSTEVSSSEKPLFPPPHQVVEVVL